MLPTNPIMELMLMIVSQIILDTLNGLEMAYPEVSAERRQELQSIRERLIKGDLD